MWSCHVFIRGGHCVGLIVKRMDSILLLNCPKPRGVPSLKRLKLYAWRLMVRFKGFWIANPLNYELNRPVKPIKKGFSYKINSLLPQISYDSTLNRSDPNCIWNRSNCRGLGTYSKFVEPWTARLDPLVQRHDLGYKSFTQIYLVS